MKSEKKKTKGRSSAKRPKKRTASTASKRNATPKAEASPEAPRASAPPRSGRKTLKKEKGAPLFEQVCRMTGIPTDRIKSELTSILDRKNLDVQNLTIDQLRHVAATYLREIMGSLLDRKSAP